MSWKCASQGGEEVLVTTVRPTRSRQGAVRPAGAAMATSPDADSAYPYQATPTRTIMSAHQREQH